MGVLGLTPFLQRTCPEVIKQLPDRLRGLAGKTIVIDGTLITQRFHFAQAPHPYRHVLGWYRLATELSEAGVSAICVFDGKERNLAKAREAERRREVRRKTAARGTLEHDRSKRLHKLSSILYRFRGLDRATQERATDLLRQLASEPATGLNVSVLSQLPPIQQIEESKILRSVPRTLPEGFRGFIPHDGDTFSSDFIPDEILETVLDNGFGSPTLPSDDLTGDMDNEPISEAQDTNSLLDSEPSLLPRSTDLETQYLPEDIDGTGPPTDLLEDGEENDALNPDAFPPSISADDIDDILFNMPPAKPSKASVTSYVDDKDVPSALANLYLNYRQSISKLAAISAPLHIASPTSPGAGDPETQADIVMTKAQYQLSLEEAAFWDDFLSRPPPAAEEELEQLPVPTTAESALASLSKTSDIMSESFQRRMNPPTSRTYDECKEILTTMGIPCLETAGAFEAEALASSMVLNGLADYVASEDTDVLVYEAPLIRNLTSRNVPLTVVSGAEIRTALQLTRDSFVDFALLLGTDFSQRIKNVGPARALKFIKEHGSIERVIELETTYPPRIPHKAYLAQVEIARMVFHTLPPLPEKSQMKPGTMDEAGVVKVMKRYGLGREVVMDGDWDYGYALAGNYFNDNPSAL